MSSESRLCRRLGYDFQVQELLEIALTHRSFGQTNYERMEFLGDAVLNFVVAAELYNRFPEASEGQLSRLRAGLVKGEALAQLATNFDLGSHLKLGSGELKSGGVRRESILAGALEAVIGAVYLDGGYRAVDTLIRTVYRERLSSIRADEGLKDPKTRLQEYLQSRKLALPVYRVLSVTGQAHHQEFNVECVVSELKSVTRGQGGTRRKAEQAAAKTALELLELG